MGNSKERDLGFTPPPFASSQTGGVSELLRVVAAREHRSTMNPNRVAAAINNQHNQSPSTTNNNNNNP